MLTSRGLTTDPAGDVPARVSRPALSRASFGHLFRLNTLLFAANAAGSLAAYLYHVVVGHLLGPSAYGTIATLVNLTYIVLIPSAIIQLVFARATASLVSSKQIGVLHAMWARLTGWLLGLGVLSAAIFSLGLSGVLTSFLHISGGVLPVVVVGLIFVVGFVTPLNQGVLQGAERFGWLAATGAGGAFLRVPLAALFIALGWGVSGAMLGLVLGLTVPYLFSLWPVWATVRAAPRQPVALRPWLRYSTTVTVAMICTTLLYNFDTILAKHFLTALDAGRYAALANTGKIVFFTGSSVVTVMFPKVAAAHTRGERHSHLLAFSLAAVLALSLAIVVVFGAFPGFVLSHMFGPAYVVVRGELLWYSLAMMLYSLAAVFVQYFLSVNRSLFLWLVACCCVGQAGALWMWHADIAAMVQVMVASMALLLIGLAILYAVRDHGAPDRALAEL